MNRREFLKASTQSVGALLGLSLFSSFSGCKSGSDEVVPHSGILEVNAGSGTDLRPREGKSFKFGNRPALLIRDKDGGLLAYDATCPHMECTVHYRPEKEDIFCPCHSGTFDIAGQKLFGPPDKPLTPLNIRLKGVQI